MNRLSPAGMNLKYPLSTVVHSQNLLWEHRSGSITAKSQNMQIIPDKYTACRPVNPTINVRRSVLCTMKTHINGIHNGTRPMK